MRIAGIGAGHGWQKNIYQGAGTEQKKGFYDDILLAASTEKNGSDKQELMMENIANEGREDGKALTREEMLQFISERREEIYQKIKNNDTETSFQIGSQSFTVREWNKLLEQFDSVQEEIREQMREEQAKRQKETTTKVLVESTASVTSEDSKNIAKAAGTVVPGDSQTGTDEKSVMDSLVAESTTCTYPRSGEEETDKRFITWYTEEGIFCREAGQTSGYFFRIAFDDSSQYEKVMDFLKQIPSDADMRFAADRTFWQEFLAGRVEDYSDIAENYSGSAYEEE